MTDQSREGMLAVTTSLISSFEKEANPEGGGFNIVFSIEKATGFIWVSGRSIFMNFKLLKRTFLSKVKTSGKIVLIASQFSVVCPVGGVDSSYCTYMLF